MKLSFFATVPTLLFSSLLGGMSSSANAAAPAWDVIKWEKGQYDTENENSHCGGVLVLPSLVITEHDCAHREGASPLFWVDGLSVSVSSRISANVGGSIRLRFLRDAQSQDHEDLVRATINLPSYLTHSELRKSKNRQLKFYPPSKYHAGKEDDPKPLSESSSFKAGQGIIAADTAGNEWLMGVMSRHGKLMSMAEHWTSVYRILKKEIKADRQSMQLATKVLNPYERIAKTWGTSEDLNRAVKAPEKLNWGFLGRKGVIGAIFPYANPFNRKLEFFRLVGLDKDQTYSYFPVNSRDNQYWEYLGEDLPTEVEAMMPIKVWSYGKADGKIGDIYVYPNPFSNQTEYFRFEAADDKGGYGYFPTNGTNSRHWTYLGTDLPTWEWE